MAQSIREIVQSTSWKTIRTLSSSATAVKLRSTKLLSLPDIYIAARVTDFVQINFY